MRGVCDRGMCDMRVYISRLVKILYKWQPYKPLVLVYLLYLFCIVSITLCIVVQISCICINYVYIGALIMFPIV